MGDYASSSKSLVEFMRRNYPLSKGWMDSKPRRRSEGDIQPFEKHLNRLYGIQQISLPRRSSSCPPSSQAIGTRFLRWSNALLPKSVYKRLDAQIGYLGQPQSRFTSARKNLTVAASLIQRQGMDLGIKLRTRSLGLPQVRSLSEQRGIRPAIRMLASGALEALCDVVRDVTSILLILGQAAWYLLRFPVTCVFAGLLFLQLLAMTYTFTSTAFLSSFCQHEIPLLRDWICGAQDLRLAQRDIVVENLNRPFQNILESGQKTSSYSLPYLLSGYETTVRTFRASLPESEYTENDQEFFRGKFAKFIDGCRSTTDIAHRFHSHVTMTIDTHVSDTEYVVRKLQEYGFLALSMQARPLNGMLAQAMAWLNSYNLVYLPVGIEPFQQKCLRSANVQAITLLEGHVEMMIHRLDEDIRLVNLLQDGMWNLGVIAEQVMEQLSKCRQTNEYQGRREQNRLSKLKEIVWGQSLEGYQIEQREKWLGKMGMQFEETVQFLIQSAYELSDARSMLQALIERLRVEGRAAKYGWEVDEWVREQTKELKTGFQDLVEQLKAFKSEKMRFDEGIFKGVRD
ncbi:MAG: hypothetical protein Q9182_006292 [Xanthomendoza sp. 2 TL-2023]